MYHDDEAIDSRVFTWSLCIEGGGSETGAIGCSNGTVEGKGRQDCDKL